MTLVYDPYPDKGFKITVGPNAKLEQKIKEQERIIGVLVEACYSVLNCEGAARAAAQFVPAYEGLDTQYHFNKIRDAIKTAM